MDYQATTPIDPIVCEEIFKVMRCEYGNPHSRNHIYGWEAEKRIEKARESIANMINCQSDEIIFTSGATESNNLAIKGLFEFYGNEKNHIIVSRIEHKCLLETCKYLETKGAKVTYINPNNDGIIEVNDIKNSITDKTLVISLMGVNNEIGTIQNIKEIGNLCRSKGIFFHTDCAQAFGKINLDVKEMCIDLMSISGHKIYGPKGIGALFVGKNPRIRLKPIIHGGGQERGMRGGTLPTALIHGFGIATEICKEKMQSESVRLKELSEYMIEELLKIPNTKLNGHKTKRWQGNVNISFEFIEGESLMMSMKDLAVSSGSACTSSSLEPSYVLKSIGLKDELAHSSIRFGIGRFTTKKEIDYAIEVTKKAVYKLRDLSPLWEMHLNGVDLDTVKWNEH